MTKRKKVRSWGEYNITQYLKDNKINYVREHKFEDCLSEKNHPLRFDFFLPDYNLLIEFQGKHHYEPVNKGWRAKKVTAATKKRDIIKSNYAKDNKIALLTIPYWEKEKEKIDINLICFFQQ